MWFWEIKNDIKVIISNTAESSSNLKDASSILQQILQFVSDHPYFFSSFLIAIFFAIIYRILFGEVEVVLSKATVINAFNSVTQRQDSRDRPDTTEPTATESSPTAESPSTVESSQVASSIPSIGSRIWTNLKNLYQTIF